MFNFSFGELLLIGTIALVVLGPDKLPAAARTAGSWIGKIKRTVSDLQNEVTSQFEAEELRRELRETQSKVDRGLSRLRQSIQSTDQEVRAALDTSGAAAQSSRTASESTVAAETSDPRVPPAPAEVREAPAPPSSGKRPLIAVGALNDPLESLQPSTAQQRTSSQYQSPNAPSSAQEQ
ncbi:Sec-independent protein translocase protein TatB [Carnimonas sp. R-84981]|uniref:Sec-independent protein translocase protein TatB n=1 Tax=Carnimonas bestiolae TaxID=3402172 RepID=UPI003EDC3E7D